MKGFSVRYQNVDLGEESTRLLPDATMVEMIAIAIRISGDNGCMVAIIDDEGEEVLRIGA